MSRAVAVRESDIVKNAYSITLEPSMLKMLAEIDKGVRYAHEIAEQAATVRITDEATNKQAASLVIELSNTQKALESMRKVFTTPLYDRKKLVDDAFKRWLGEPSRQETRLRAEAGEWFMAKKREAEAAQRKLDEEAAKAAAKARATGRAVPAPVAAPIEAPAATTRTEAGTFNVRTKKVGTLVDINLVPRQYLMVNDKAVSAAINDGGVAAIPGIKIDEVPITSAR